MVTISELMQALCKVKSNSTVSGKFSTLGLAKQCAVVDFVPLSSLDEYMSLPSVKENTASSSLKPATPASVTNSLKPATPASVTNSLKPATPASVSTTKPPTSVATKPSTPSSTPKPATTSSTSAKRSERNDTDSDMEIIEIIKKPKLSNDKVTPTTNNNNNDVIILENGQPELSAPLQPPQPLQPVQSSTLLPPPKQTLGPQQVINLTMDTVDPQQPQVPTQPSTDCKGCKKAHTEEGSKVDCGYCAYLRDTLALIQQSNKDMKALLISRGVSF